MMTLDSEELAVPIAIAVDGTLVRPSGAKKGTAYRCPECSEQLLFRKGEIVQPHFAHRGDSKCNPESILHKAGKHCVAEVVREWKAGRRPKPLVVKKHTHCDREEGYDLSEAISDTKLEYRIESGRILDVALLAKEEVALGVEIYVTHRVDAAKKSAIPYPWIELDATILIENPSKWVCRQESKCFPECERCVANLKAAQERFDREMDELRRRQEEYRRTQASRVTEVRRSYYRPPPPPPPVLRPILPSGRLHVTTFMPLEKVDMGLESMGLVLDAIGEIPRGTLLPGGGVLQAPEESIASLRDGLSKLKDMEEYRKRALLWRLSEILVPALKYPKGTTEDERKYNADLIAKAIDWLSTDKLKA